MFSEYGRAGPGPPELGEEPERPGRIMIPLRHLFDIGLTGGHKMLLPRIVLVHHDRLSPFNFSSGSAKE